MLLVLKEIFHCTAKFYCLQDRSLKSKRICYTEVRMPFVNLSKVTSSEKTTNYVSKRPDAPWRQWSWSLTTSHESSMYLFVFTSCHVTIHSSVAWNLTRWRNIWLSSDSKKSDHLILASVLGDPTLQQQFLHYWCRRLHMADWLKLSLPGGGEGVGGAGSSCVWIRCRSCDKLSDELGMRTGCIISGIGLLGLLEVWASALSSFTSARYSLNIVLPSENVRAMQLVDFRCTKKKNKKKTSTRFPLYFEWTKHELRSLLT